MRALPEHSCSVEVVEGAPPSSDEPARGDAPPWPSALDGGGTEAKRRLTTLVQANYDFLWRTARRLGLPASAADDAVQQVFLVAARRLGDMEEGAERAFLYRTTVLVVRAARRNHARAPDPTS